MKREWY